MLKKIAGNKNQLRFASTVPVLFPVGSATGSFFLKVQTTNNNTPPMPLNDAHLGGFLFYSDFVL
jgi:hypothetical protein